MTDVGPIDVDVNSMDPADFARLQVTRVIADTPEAWAELGWDAHRYGRPDEVTAQLAGFVEQLVGVLAEQHGRSAAELWRAWLLADAQEST